MPRILCGLALFLVLGPWALPSQALEPGPIPQWIWDPHAGPGNAEVTLQKEFTLLQKPSSASCWLLADDLGFVELNGQVVVQAQGTRRIQPVEVSRGLRPGRNQITVRARNAGGPAGVALMLRLVDESARVSVLTTDPTWQIANAGTEPRFAESLGMLGVFPWGNPLGETEDYYQWKQALGLSQAHDPASIDVMPGFAVDLVRSSAAGEGSWVSLTFDSRGRAIIGREGKGLLRYSLPPGERMELINDTLEECRGVLCVGRDLFANANNSRALFRLRDTNGDDQFDEVRLLKSTSGGVGHGRNGLALGPDGWIYTIHGNNVRLPADYQPGHSPLQHFAEDKLIPCEWDRFLFDADAVVPAGHVARIDPEGQRWELVAGGFRNPYGLDFNAEGELFTFDADNEGDIGTPWYRPTRINHVVPGGDYGFRQGTANRHAHFAEHLPANLDIGLGSPTGVRFGTRSTFPEQYRRALYALDWSYGRLYVVHLIPRGAGYVCAVEKLIEGRPLNVTDLAFGPDGALYFVVGGRGTQSGLYRVRWAPPANATPSLLEPESLDSEPARAARSQRRRLEALLGRRDRAAVELAGPLLGSADPWLRHAARTALEFQPTEEWSSQVLNDTDPGLRQITGLLALARVGDKALQAAVLSRLARCFVPETWSTLSTDLRLDALRALSVCLSRMGRPDESALAEWVALLDPLLSPPELDLPPRETLVLQRACELAVYFESPRVVPLTLAIIERTASAEDRLRYLYHLRTARGGWTPVLRRQYFELLRNLDHHLGGNLLPVALDLLRNDVLARLSEGERVELEQLFVRDDREAAEAALALKSRPIISRWTLASLEPQLQELGPANPQAGELLFRQALCIRCHRAGGAGGAVGPELSRVANRFGPRDLLEMIVDPNKSIDEKYRQTQVETKDGRVITGRLVGGDDATLLLAPDALAPRQTVKVQKADVESQSVSGTSPMPAGLLDTFTPAEIRDLLAYLRGGGRTQ